MTYAKSIPTLSLKDFTQGDAAAQQAFVDALWEGFRYFGFVILQNHNVDTALLKRAYTLSETYFSAAPHEKKEQISDSAGQRGYTPFGVEHAKHTDIADLKEFFQVGREFSPQSPLADVYPPNLWPPLNDFKETFTTLFNALEEAGLAMLQALEGPLQVEKGFFRQLATNGNSILRLLHYPPIPDDADPNAVRAAAHEDINLITILVAANGAGLELLNREGQWQPIETAPEDLIVDAGDMLARITNDIIPATTHRVVNPKGPNVSRYSMPFFMHPHSEATLTCLESCLGEGAKYPPINADEFLRERLREIGLAT